MQMLFGKNVKSVVDSISTINDALTNYSTGFQT
jgi:hypothetical protein